ncbi:MAG: V4R domain-containing protein, partial [Candidatus Helarchaeales archaeon]
PEPIQIKNLISLENPNDISKLRYLIEMVREKLENVQNVRWIIDDITNMVITIGSEEKVLRFLREFSFILKQHGDLGLLYVDRNAISQQFVASLENMVETVIHLSISELSSGLVPHLRVIKNRFFGEKILSVRVPYEFLKTEIALQADLTKSFDLIKKSLAMSSEGMVELFGKRHFILPEETFVDLYKKLYERIDYNEYKKLTYESGRRMADIFIAHYKNLFDLTKSEIARIVTNHATNLGFGKIEFKKMDFRKGVVIIQAKNLFKFESLNPIHSYIAGVMSRLTELITEEPWEFFESKCVATNDEHCEFIGSPSKDLAPLSTDIRKIKDELSFERDGTLSLFGTRVLLMPQGTLLHIVDSAEDIVGYEKAKEILYHAGERMALQFCQILTSKYNLTGASILRVYMQIVSTRGWGIAEIKELDLERGYLRVIVKNPLIGAAKQNSKNEHEIELNSHKETGKDFISSGVFAGILEFITKKKLICEEIKCITRGDPHCEFEVSPLDEYSPLVL